MGNEQKKTRKSFEIDMVRGPCAPEDAQVFAAADAFQHSAAFVQRGGYHVVGRFAGDNSLAAVGSNTALISLLTNLFIGLSVGANVVVARYFGGLQAKGSCLTRCIRPWP